MQVNGHELESRYLLKIISLRVAKEKPSWTDSLWRGRYIKQLKMRLSKMEDDYENGFISLKAYKVWKQMIDDVIC